MAGLEAAELQFHRHQAAQAAVEKEQVEIEVVAVDDHPFLALDKGKTPAQLQDEGLKLAQDGVLQVSLIVALAQAQEIKKIGVLED